MNRPHFVPVTASVVHSRGLQFSSVQQGVLAITSNQSPLVSIVKGDRTRGGVPADSVLAMSFWLWSGGYSGYFGLKHGVKITVFTQIGLP